MKTLTLNLSEEAWGALVLAVPQSTFDSVEALARNAIGQHAACMLEGTKENAIVAHFEAELGGEQEHAPAARTLALELSPAAWAALEFASLDCGNASIEAGAREALRAFTVATLENYADSDLHGKQDGRRLFAHPAESEEEDVDATTAAANRDDLPLAAAGKPCPPSRVVPPKKPGNGD